MRRTALRAGLLALALLGGAWPAPSAAGSSTAVAGASASPSPSLVPQPTASVSAAASQATPRVFAPPDERATPGAASGPEAGSHRSG